MKSFSEYYEPHVPIQKDIDALSDPKLDHVRDRNDVNKLLINLALKYAAEYLQVSPYSIEGIEQRAMEAVQSTPADAMRLILDVIAKSTGEQATGESGLAQTDIVAVESLIDLRSTAAIMKEIIFGGDFMVEKNGPFGNNFIGLDIGHGTGILTLATYIAARRREINDIIMLGFDISPVAVEKSERTLNAAVPSYNFKVGQADVTNPSIWEVFHGLPLHYLVTETISTGIPPIIKRDGKWVLENEGDKETSFSLVTNADVDPFTQIFLNATRCHPGLEDDIRFGCTAMFPDIVRGNFKSDGENSTLYLHTGISQAPLKLHDVGSEFKDFQELQIGNHRRWQEESEEMTKIIDRLRAQQKK
jgi:hypothetical protein